MSDLTVARVSPSAVEPAPFSGPAAPSAIAPARPDGIAARPRSYIVIGRPPLSLLPPRASGPMSGRLFGQPWSTMQLTEAEATRLRDSGMSVVEDLEVRVPPVTRSEVRANNIRAQNLFARDIHGANELARRGEEWQGRGGLFITVDTGAGLHRDLRPLMAFDNVFTPQPFDTPSDPNTHGTHVRGSAQANGNVEQGGTRGMAPLSDGMAVQVLNDNGGGTLSSVLKGLERAVELAQGYEGPVVVNLSLGGGTRDRANDPLAQFIDRATREHGILFTVAAGNDGWWGNGTIGTPGIAPMALTFGAMDHRDTLDPSDDRVAAFSSRDVANGPKPNATARGVAVRSTVPAPDPFAVSDRYEAFDGTSMASPIGGGGVLSVLTGLHAMWRRGELTVNPRDLVRSGELQAFVERTAVDNPAVPRNVEGGGDLRLVALADAIVARYRTPAPVPTPAPSEPAPAEPTPAPAPPPPAPAPTSAQGVTPERPAYRVPF